MPNLNDEDTATSNVYACVSSEGGTFSLLNVENLHIEMTKFGGID